MTEPPSESINPSRRDFLTLTWLGLGGLVLAQAGVVALTFLQPPRPSDAAGQVITAGPVDNFSPGTATPFPAYHFYLARLADGGLLAFYRRCPHLGCSVLWDEAANQFTCPCHASIFDPQGQVINPPAPRPLDLLAVTVEAGLVKVDTGHIIRRQAGEAAPVVYP